MNLRRFLGLLAIILLVAFAVLAYAFLRTPEAATGPIQAPTLVIVAANTPIPPTSTPEPATSTPAIAATLPPEATPTLAPTLAPEPEPAAARLFEIRPEESTAHFLINEVLRGTENAVVGATNQVAGQIAIDAATPANTQVGQILVNARTLTTDNDFRNRAIKNQILRTDAFEFVTFTPTAISGLPASVAIGDTLQFQIGGDLTITDVTRAETFDVTLTVVSAGRIEGLATLTIRWADYNLRIPSSPQVETVADSVILQLEFVAEGVG